MTNLKTNENNDGIIMFICIVSLALIFFTTVFHWNKLGSEGYIGYHFLEPDGYVIAEIKTTESSVAGGFFYFAETQEKYYGYISNEDYQSYLDGTLNNALMIKHPFTDGVVTTLSSDKIVNIQTGIYNFQWADSHYVNLQED